MTHKYSSLTKFKHDTIGKFQILKELLESINEDNIRTEDSIEILKEVKISFEKMQKATEQLLKDI